ncbi:MAG: extensin family protein [Hyphomicrobium sp.]
MRTARSIQVGHITARFASLVFASAGALALAEIRAVGAEPVQVKPVAEAPPAAKPRTGVRIELKVPQIPGITAPSKDAGKDAGKSKSWPKTLPEAEAEKDAKSKPPETWSPTEIGDAKARCAVILKRINAVAIPETPMREGVCGTPAPIQLISIGKNPQVALSPPAIVNCDFAEALQTWLEGEVQPLARKNLGTNVIKIEVMSSYSCRNAYGRAGNKLSEHGLANALDIRGFVTATGKTAYVLEDWGTPQREIIARIAAEKAEAAKALAALQAAETAAQAAQASNKASNKAGAKGTAPENTANAPPAATGSTAGGPASGIARTTITDGMPKLTVTIPGAAQRNEDAADDESSFSVAPNRLGGPKPDGKTEADKSKVSKVSDGERKEAFLHETHAAACRMFGTTLGPEANAAHRNHLHLDRAQRKSTTTKICD